MSELKGNVFKPEVIRGKDGKSAYEIAKDNGFAGSEEEWLESLKPPNITTQFIPVFVNDMNGLLGTPHPDGGVYDLSNYFSSEVSTVLYSYGGADLYYYGKGITDTLCFLPCYNSDKYHAELSISVMELCVIANVFFKDETREPGYHEILGGDAAYISLDAAIDHIEIDLC